MKVALITGATRGIGRAIALGLAKNGYNIVVAGKSIINNPKLPGTIYSVSKEVEALGSRALPVKVDIRNYDDIKNMIQQTESKFGRLDVVINNAGVLSWKPIKYTNVKEYDLVNEINNRGTFLLSKLALPLLEKSGGGHIINQSPPLSDNNEMANILENKTAYMISKWGMTLSALGLAKEYEGTGICANTLWPMTPIESFAVINNNLGDPKSWRKTDIMLDCVLEILNEDPKSFTGNQLIDETYLRSKGYTNFEKYQCVPGFEAPKLDDIQHLFKSSL